MRPRPPYAFPTEGSNAHSEDEAIKIVVGDDHDFVRRSLTLLLDGEVGLEVVGEAGDLAAALDDVHRHQPHVLVLDPFMPGGFGLEAIRRLRAEAPNTQIVVATMRDDPRLARGALAAGAIGYVLKDTAEEDLPKAVRRASAGKRFLTPRVAARLAAYVGGEGDPLTPREIDVLQLVALGNTKAEIASQLHMSIHAVESHRRRLHLKLGSPPGPSSCATRRDGAC